jgi:trigger factor
VTNSETIPKANSTANSKANSDAATQEFSNDNIRVNVEKKPGCVVALEIFVRPEATQAAYKKAVKTISKQVTIPGFRQGKAPDEMIKKRYPADVDSEWRNILMNMAFQEGASLAGLYPWKQEKIKSSVEELSLENGGRVKFNFEAEPTIPSLECAELTLKKVEKVPVTEELIKKRLEIVRGMQCDFEEVKDRPVQEGDAVWLQVESLEQDPPRLLSKNDYFEINKERIGEWMHALLIGANKDQAIEGTSHPNSNVSAEEKARFHPVKYRLTVKNIKKKILLDDEAFLKRVGADSMENLLGVIRQRLESEEVMRVHQELKSQLWDSLLAKHPFDVPGSLFDEEVRDIMKKKIRNLHEIGMADEAIRQKEPELRTEAEKDVLHHLRMLFITRQVAANNRIQPSKDEVSEKTILTMTQHAMSGAQLQNSQEQYQHYYNQAFMELLQQHVEEHLLKQVSLT